MFPWPAWRWWNRAGHQRGAPTAATTVGRARRQALPMDASGEGPASGGDAKNQKVLPPRRE
eukprot:15458127-Alexandrium_andersonii.AAC.1